MCGACDRQERVCPADHVSPKRHGDVFGPESLCPDCGKPTRIRRRSVDVEPAPVLRPIGDAYEVTVNGVVLGEVSRVRLRSDRYRFGESSVRGRGRTRWVASPGVNDEDFATRREAVQELVRRRASTRPAT